MTKTEFMLLAIYNKPRLNIEEVCNALGMSTATGYTHRSLGKFPVKMSGSPLGADIRDVGAALDELREQARLNLAGVISLGTTRPTIIDEQALKRMLATVRCAALEEAAKLLEGAVSPLTSFESANQVRALKTIDPANRAH
ncbi:AlpA family transcriptional regulator [Massilia sp. CCM 8734]|uniref:helix-turn-helix transcriptional regulator n=1 Tax=Massilia sp. CCM 8734 TaxID=2609283 RepID=UPI00141E0960|nr:hypothetical protein [Massilia sp. CCM 8734]NIA00086.1 hypothetical protein [Massilia sp. CCM 8734]